MKIFINDKPLKLIQYESRNYTEGYDSVVQAAEEITSKKLVGHVIVVNASTLQLERVLRLMEVKKLKKLKAITFSVTDYETYKDFLKDQYKVIKASGGVVRKGEKILMIYRLKKWDLPKGKLKKGEDSLKGAKREVEEECNIRVDVREKICSTWHTYTRKEKRILKKTDWYLMNCTDDSNMRPQLEEFIEDVKWLKKDEALKNLKNSYASIEEVMNQYFLTESLSPLNTKLG
ncbi:MAG: NUDIX hydrolase [Cytophagaceae bacterium]|jgi:ADP-ribose pyrophosphatase YjhB (NUDIX family)|nr:NUDIX hydrolase [Cytophagaceae bacterium]